MPHAGSLASAAECASLLQKDYLNLWLGSQISAHYIFGNARYDTYEAHYSNTALALAEPLLGYIF